MYFPGAFKAPHCLIFLAYIRLFFVGNLLGRHGPWLHKTVYVELKVLVLAAVLRQPFPRHIIRIPIINAAHPAFCELGSCIYHPRFCESHVGKILWAFYLVSAECRLKWNGSFWEVHNQRLWVKGRRQGYLLKLPCIIFLALLNFASGFPFFSRPFQESCHVFCIYRFTLLFKWLEGI